jgi:hypothetical protein
MNRSQRDPRTARADAERKRAAETARGTARTTETWKEERDRLTAALIDTNERYVNAEIRNLVLQGQIDRLREGLTPFANVNTHIKRMQKDKCSACGKPWPCISESIRVILAESENP